MLAVVDHARQRGAVAHHVDPERAAQRHAGDQRADQQQQDRRVDQHARPEHAPQPLRRRQVLRQAVLRGVADQPARVVHLVHHAVADVDAGGAADAFVLQALADVDAGRADLHAQPAVDAVAQAQRLAVGLARARAARLAALGVVADDQRVLVEHRALEARVRAHVLADLLAHEAGVAVGGEAVEQHPEASPTGPSAQLRHQLRQRADRREVADEGEAGPQRDGDPDRLLGHLRASCGRGPRAGVELHARDAVALELALDPHEDLGVDRLRAGIAAPQPPGHRGEQEQRVGRDDQQRRSGR